jgi:hypothetical protein
MTYGDITNYLYCKKNVLAFSHSLGYDGYLSKKYFPEQNVNQEILK